MRAFSLKKAVNVTLMIHSLSSILSTTPLHFAPTLIHFTHLCNLLWKWRAMAFCLSWTFLLNIKMVVFIISIYLKPTFTGLYTNWNSFVPVPRKINLISTLVHRALMICAPCTLNQEPEKIRCIFINNCFPINVLKHH